MLKIARRYRFDLLDYFYIVLGSFIISFAFQVFLLPNSIVSGGITGLSVVINDLFGWAPSLIQYAFNIPLLVICYIFLGKAAGNKTVLGSILSPFFIQLISSWEPWTTDPFLATVFGGAITGIGLGMVFRAKASTGGTSIIIQIFSNITRIKLGTSTLIVDGLVIASALIVFNVEIVMYSIITLFLSSKVIDVVQVGFSVQKNVFIISDQPEQIRNEIMHTLHRGVTNLGIRGGYGNTDKDMLMVVIQEREFTYLKDAILDVDDDAFVVAMSATEVLGRGFSLTKEFESNSARPYANLENEE